MIAIPFAPGYFVTEYGAVYSTRKLNFGTNENDPPHLMHPYIRRRYLTVLLQIDGKKRHVPIHRIVCRVFHGEPNPGQEVRHLNGSNFDNRQENLAWGTVKENRADERIHGTLPLGARHGRSKLTARQVVHIRHRFKRGMTDAEIARQFHVWPSSIGRIRKGIGWRHTA